MDDVAAPPLFLPGLLCDHTIWRSQLDELRDLRPAAFPNYGLASSFSQMSVMVLDFAPRRFSLVGHSMGARVALEIVRTAPERVARLALLDTGVHPPKAGEAEKRYALLELGRREGIDRLVDAWLPPMVHPDRQEDAELMAPLHAMAVGQGLAVFEAQIQALLGRPDATSVLSQIDCPTLVGVGRQDAWSPLDQHEFIASNIRGSVLAVFEDSGHMSPVEAPAQVNAALRRWMNLT